MIKHLGKHAWLVGGISIVAGLTAVAVATTVPGGRCAANACIAPSASAAPDGNTTSAHAASSTTNPTEARLTALGSSDTGQGSVSPALYSPSGSGRHLHGPKPGPSSWPSSSPSSSPSASAPPAPPGTGSAHSAIRYIADGVDSAVGAVKALGYNVIDVSSTNRSTIDGYGAKVIIYTGYDKDTCQWNVPDATWHSQVLNLRDDANVVGWFLADEPHPYDNGKCLSSADQIKARSDFLHANAPGQKAMIVILDGSNACGTRPEGCEYAFFNEAATHADLIGIDPYVCSTAHPSCDYSKITQRVQSAVANGIPLTKIMPVYQAFGGDGYYLMPTPAQETALLQTWDSLAPSGGWAGEYTYEWSQGSEPDGLSNHPQVQSVFASHNGV